VPSYPDEMAFSDGVLPVDGGGESERGGGEPAKDAVMGEMVSFAAFRRALFAASAAARAASTASRILVPSRVSILWVGMLVDLDVLLLGDMFVVPLLVLLG
jgi:hypothetical protein